MDHFFFWRGWDPQHRSLYLTAFLLLPIAVGYYLMMYFQGPSQVYQWGKAGEIQEVPFIMEKFNKNFFEFSLEVKSYLITETFQATDLTLAPAAYQAYLGFLLIGLVLLLSAIPSLSLTLFFFGMGVLLMLLATLGLDRLPLQHEWPGQSLLVLSIVLLGGGAIVFHFFLKNIPYVIRFSYNTLVTGLLVWLVGYYHAVPDATERLACEGMVVPLLLTVFFILIVAGEIPRMFVHMTTHPAWLTQGNPFKKFLFLSGLYLVNLVYVYLLFSKILDLDIYYLHPLLIIAVSTLAGVWGFRWKEPQYQGMFAFQPTGGFIYLGLALVALAAMSFALATQNDSLIEVYEDAVLFSHIGFGIGYVAYAYFNFADMMAAQKPVYRIFFKPMQFDHLYVLFIAGLFMATFLLNNSFFTYDQAFAGYYNLQGDLYRKLGQNYESKQSYNLATGYDPKNHRSFYALGNLAEQEGDLVAASYFYNEAIFKKPTPQAYARIAAILAANNRFFDAVFSYQKGLMAFPKNGELMNNLAMMYQRTDMADSVYIYLEQAREYASKPEIVEANLFALYTKYAVYDQLDSVYAGKSPVPYIVTKANELAFVNAYGQAAPAPLDLSFLQDSLLATPEMCYLYNYALNQAAAGSPVWVEQLKRFLAVEGNGAFHPYLQFALALHYYFAGDMANAFALMEERYAFGGLTNPDYAHLLGLWYMDMEDYERATFYFGEAFRRGSDDDQLNQAIASSELPDKQQAIGLWEAIVANAKDPEIVNLASDMLFLLNPERHRPTDFTDKGIAEVTRYRYLHYQGPQLGSERFLQVVATLENGPLKMMALSEKLGRLLDQGDTQSAAMLFTQMAGIPLDAITQPLLNQTYLRFKTFTQSFDQDFLEKLQSASFSRTQADLPAYYRGCYALAKGQVSEAIAFFDQAVQKNPFRESNYTGLADAHIAMGQLDEAYTVLIEGIRKHPGAFGLLQRYALTALDLSYLDYAEDARQELQAAMPAALYQPFERVYREKRAAVEKRYEAW
jgi:Flp pilus assembly protein TadD